MNTEKSILQIVDEIASELDYKENYTRNRVKYNVCRFINWMVRNKIDVRHPRRADVISYKQAMISEGKKV